MVSKQPLLWSDPSFMPVAPVQPVAPWVGGKRNLATQLVALIEDTPHVTYAEPFVGMGGVFFRRGLRPKAEVINDYSRDVVNLFRILREHHVPFVDMLRYQLSTRADFQRLIRTDPDTLTDLQRAARFLFLQRTAFGGKVEGRNFGVSPAEPSAFDVRRLVPLLEDVHERLTGVTIECLPYGEFIARYDRAETLFYLDPPYEGSEDFYGKGMFGQDDHLRLAEQLAGLKGRFILSINDTPAMRAAFGRFALMEVTVTYTVSETQAKPMGELIVRN